jgi:hypothetical protein
VADAERADKAPRQEFSVELLTATPLILHPLWQGAQLVIELHAACV